MFVHFVRRQQSKFLSDEVKIINVTRTIQELFFDKSSLKIEEATFIFSIINSNEVSRSLESALIATVN